MHRHVTLEVVHEGGYECNHTDVGVADLGKRRHEEGHRPHHRGHEDSPRRGDRLDRRGEMGHEARPLHHGDGEGARDDDVGRAAPDDHAHQPARDDGGLRRTSPQVPHEGEGDLHEDIAHLCHLEDGAEKDEEEDIARVHPRHGAEDALRPEDEGHQFVEGEARVGQAARNMISVQGVEAEEDSQRGEHPSEHAPAHLDGDHDGEDAHDHVMPLDDARPLAPVGEVGGIVEEDGQGDHEQNDVHRGGPVAWRALPGREGEEGEDAGKEDVQRQVIVERIDLQGRELEGPPEPGERPLCPCGKDGAQDDVQGFPETQEEVNLGPVCRPVEEIGAEDEGREPDSDPREEADPGRVEERKGRNPEAEEGQPDLVPLPDAAFREIQGEGPPSDQKLVQDENCRHDRPDGNALLLKARGHIPAGHRIGRDDEFQPLE